MLVTKPMLMEVLEVLSDYEDDPSEDTIYELYITLLNLSHIMKEDIA